MRKKYGFSVYSIASYVQEGARVNDPATLAKADIAKQLHLIFERDVDGQSIATSFRGSIGANHPAPAFTPELAEVRDQLVADGEQVMRGLLAPVLNGPELDAAVLMLTGAVLNSAVLHGQLPSDAVIAAAVDLVLCTLERRRPDS